MKELQEIIKAFNQAQQTGKKTALATVVHVEGSSYRRAGARMLITDDGQLTGAISGGCLEGDALRKARLVIAQQKPMLVTYDTTDDDDAKLGVQLGCNGIIHILIEPVLPEQPDNPISFFTRFLSQREPAVIVTIFNMTDRHEPQLGTCFFMNKAGQSAGELPDMVGNELLNNTTDILHAGEVFTKTYTYYEKYTCFIELLQPPIALVVVGAGNDAIPLIQMAKVLGWNITLVDGRPNYPTPERFPMADKLLIAKPNEVMAQLRPDNYTAFMLMTHNYNYDKVLLEHLLPSQLPYIGILGPKKRLNRILQEISGVGIEQQLTHIYGPAGLDIGSENPEQIALSILAEIQGVLNKLSGVPLRSKAYIHDRSDEQVLQSVLPDNLNV